MTLCRQLCRLFNKNNNYIIASNNVDTLVEAIISPNERVHIRITRKNFKLKTTKKSILNPKNAFQFQITVILKRRKLTTILTEESHDIKVKIFNTVDRAAASSRHP
jgi:hypothetical protein